MPLGSWSLEPVNLLPIGVVHSHRTEAIDDDWDKIESYIELDATQFDESVLAGLAEFSHVEVIYAFHRVPDSKIEKGARHPRGRTDWPLVGIFAQRGKNRPNRLGSTVCRVLRVDRLKIELEGLDAIDGSPVLDIKPLMSGFLARGDFKEPNWAKEIMLQYWRQ
jgi:tRNA (adenine37-N6)-methyltransferase